MGEGLLIMGKLKSVNQGDKVVKGNHISEAQTDVQVS